MTDTIEIPDRPLGRLEAHHFAAAQSDTHLGYTPDYIKLLTEFAFWNEMSLSWRGFDLAALAVHAVDGEIDEHHSRGFEHVCCFRRGRRPVALLVEPYEPEVHIERLRALADELGLVLHTPPNMYASFHFPGWTGCLLFTRPDFGEVVWLEEQHEFTVHGEVR